MPRKPRIDFPDAWHHVMNRGIAKRVVFESDLEKRFFLSLVAREVRRGRIEVHAVCVLDTHFHLLVRSPNGELSVAFQAIKSVFVQRFNFRRGRDGALFRGRFLSKLVDNLAYRRELVRYIDQNPVAAGLADHPAEYPFCTAHYWQTGRPPPWVERCWIEEELRLTTAGRYTGPMAYADTFGRRDQRPGVALPETATPDAIADEFARNLRMSDGDGRRPTPPEALARLEGVDAAWLDRAVPGRHADTVRDLITTALLRRGCGLGLQEIGRKLEISATTAHRRYLRHQAMARNDGHYANLVKRLFAR